MTDDRDTRSPAERLVERSRISEAGTGRPLSERALQRVRSVESTLLGDAIPRYIRRAAEIERAVRTHERDLASAYAALRAEHTGGGADAFAAAWLDHVDRLDFGEVNTLIEQHNAWYPIERDLPIDLRTRDYVLVNGHDYRKTPLDRDWVLARFPAH